MRVGGMLFPDSWAFGPPDPPEHYEDDHEQDEWTPEDGHPYLGRDCPENGDPEFFDGTDLRGAA